MTRQFLLFLAAGGTAAAANYGSRFMFSLWAPYELAIALAYLIGMLVAFTLMRQFVFTASGKPLGQQVWRFTLVNALALLQTLIISVVLARWVLPALGFTEHTQAIAHLVGVLVPVGTSYVGHKFATFK
jgi:putative flippase GtrA